VRVKLAERAGARTVKAESDDLLSVRGGRVAREDTRRKAEEAVKTADNAKQKKDE